MADQIIDTSDMTVHELRHAFLDVSRGATGGQGLVATFLSFGFKHGLPLEADLVFDVRFLPNPNFVAALKRRTGRHPAVVRFMRRQPDTGRFLRRLESFLADLIPRYIREGKRYLTIAIGCTGGRHRSVMVVNALAKALGRRGHAVRVRHRDVRL